MLDYVKMERDLQQFLEAVEEVKQHVSSYRYWLCSYRYWLCSYRDWLCEDGEGPTTVPRSCGGGQTTCKYNVANFNDIFLRIHFLHFARWHSVSLCGGHKKIKLCKIFICALMKLKNFVLYVKNNRFTYPNCLGFRNQWKHRFVGITRPDSVSYSTNAENSASTGTCEIQRSDG